MFYSPKPLHFTCCVRNSWHPEISPKHRLHLFRAEKPSSSPASTSAPAASSTQHISTWPPYAARCSAVAPQSTSVAATAPGSLRVDVRRGHGAGVPPQQVPDPAEVTVEGRRDDVVAASEGHGPPRRAPVEGPQRPQRRPKILYKN